MHTKSLWILIGIGLVFIVGSTVIFFDRSVERFSVQKVTNEEGQEKSPVVTKKECVVSGCSGQLCLEKVKSQDGMVSTCEWLDEYQCYKSVVCEEQLNGLCGWTVTPEFTNCLEESRSSLNDEMQVPVSAEVKPTLTPERVPEILHQNAPENDSVNFTPSIDVKKNLVSWGFSKERSSSVNSIILHSSYNSLGKNKYDVNAIIDIYETYGVSPHYIIGRDGSIFQLVKEVDTAYHAGVSALPNGVTDVNSASIGIEIVNDDKGDSYTSEQYTAINALIADIKKRHAIIYILGHEDIAPGRKSDPWNLDWQKIKK